MKENMLLTLIFTILCADLRVNGMIFKFIPGGDSIRNVITPFLSNFNTTDEYGRPSYTANVVRVVDPILAMRFAKDDMVSSPRDYDNFNPYSNYPYSDYSYSDYPYSDYHYSDYPYADYYSPQDSFESIVGDPGYSSSEQLTRSSRFGILPWWGPMLPPSQSGMHDFRPSDNFQDMPRGIHPFGDAYLDEYNFPHHEYPVIERYPMRRSALQFNPSLQDDSQYGVRNGKKRPTTPYSSPNSLQQNSPQMYRPNNAPFLEQNQNGNQRLSDPNSQSPYGLAGPFNPSNQDDNQYGPRNGNMQPDSPYGSSNQQLQYIPQMYRSNNAPFLGQNQDINSKLGGPNSQSPYGSAEQFNPSQQDDNQYGARNGKTGPTSPYSSPNSLQQNFPQMYRSNNAPFLGLNQNMNTGLGDPDSRSSYESAGPFNPSSQDDSQYGARNDGISSNSPYSSPNSQLQNISPMYRSRNAPFLAQTQDVNSRLGDQNLRSTYGPAKQLNPFQQDDSRYGAQNGKMGPTLPYSSPNSLQQNFQQMYRSNNAPVLGQNQNMNPRLGDPNSKSPYGSADQLNPSYQDISQYGAQNGDMKPNSLYDSPNSQLQNISPIYRSSNAPFLGQNQDMNSGLSDANSRSPYGPADQFNPSSLDNSQYGARDSNMQPNSPYNSPNSQLQNIQAPYRSNIAPLFNQNQDMNTGLGDPSSRSPYGSMTRTPENVPLGVNSKSQNPYSNDPIDSDDLTSDRTPFYGPKRSDYNPTSRQPQGFHSNPNDFSSNTPPKYNLHSLGISNSRSDVPYAKGANDFDGITSGRNPSADPYNTGSDSMSRQPQGFNSRPNEFASDPPQSQYKPYSLGNSNFRSDNSNANGDNGFNPQISASKPSGYDPMSSPSQKMNSWPGNSDSNGPLSQYSPYSLRNSNPRAGDPYSNSNDDFDPKTSAKNQLAEPYNSGYNPMSRQSQKINSWPGGSYLNRPQEQYDPYSLGNSNSRSNDPYSNGDDDFDAQTSAKNQLDGPYNFGYNLKSQQPQRMNSWPGDSYSNKLQSRYNPYSFGNSNSKSDGFYSNGGDDFEPQTSAKNQLDGPYNFGYNSKSRQPQKMNSWPGDSYSSQYSPYSLRNSNLRSGDPYLNGDDDFDPQTSAKNQLAEPYNSGYNPMSRQPQKINSWPGDSYSNRPQAQYDPYSLGNTNARSNDSYSNVDGDFDLRTSAKNQLAGPYNFGYNLKSRQPQRMNSWPGDSGSNRPLSQYSPYSLGNSNSRSYDPYSNGDDDFDPQTSTKNSFTEPHNTGYNRMSRPPQRMNSWPGKSDSYQSMSQYNLYPLGNSNSRSNAPYSNDEDDFDPQTSAKNQLPEPYNSGYNPMSRQPQRMNSWPGDSNSNRPQAQFDPYSLGNFNSRSDDLYSNGNDDFDPQTSYNNPLAGPYNSGYNPSTRQPQRMNSRPGSFYSNRPRSQYDQFSLGNFNTRSYDPYFTGATGPHDSNSNSNDAPSVSGNVGDDTKSGKNSDNGGFWGPSDSSGQSFKPSPEVYSLLNKLLVSTTKPDSKVGSSLLGSYDNSPFKLTEDSKSVNYGIFEPNYGNYPIYSFDNVNPSQNFNHQNNPTFNSNQPSSKPSFRPPSKFSSLWEPRPIVSPIKSQPNFLPSLFTPVGLAYFGKDADEDYADSDPLNSADPYSNPSDLSQRNPSDYNKDGVRISWPMDPKELRSGNPDGPEKVEVPTDPPAQPGRIPALLIIPAENQTGENEKTQGSPQDPDDDSNLGTITTTKNVNLLPIQLPESFWKNLLNSGVLPALLNKFSAGDGTAGAQNTGQMGRTNIDDQNSMLGARGPSFTMLNPNKHKVELYNPVIRGYHGGINPFANNHKGSGYKSY